MTRTARRPGLTLIEMTAVMVILIVALTIGVGLLVAVLHADRAGAATHRRVAWRAALGDQFRADAARATGTADAVGPLAAGPGCLILRTAGGGHVAYVWDAGRLERVERPAAGPELRRVVPTGRAGTAVEFARPAGDRPLVTLRLSEPNRRGPALRSDISAALGGDVR